MVCHVLSLPFCGRICEWITSRESFVLLWSRLELYPQSENSKKSRKCRSFFLFVLFYFILFRWMQSVKQLLQEFCVKSILCCVWLTAVEKFLECIASQHETLQKEALLFFSLSFTWSLVGFLQVGPMLGENSDHFTSQAMSKSSG